jgi:hypothetical protein
MPTALFALDIFFKIFIVVLGRGTLWHLQKFLHYIKYIIAEFTLPTFSFISPSPQPRPRSSYLYFPPCWDNGSVPPHPASFVEMGV